MYKKSLILITALIASNATTAMDNRYFSLARESLSLAVHLAESPDIDLFVKNLKDCLSDDIDISEKGFFSLPRKAQNLADMHYFWMLSKKYGSEQLLISYLDQISNDTKNRQKNYFLYIKETRKIDLLIANNSPAVWCGKAVKETAQQLLESIECILNTKTQIQMLYCHSARFDDPKIEEDEFETEILVDSFGLSYNRKKIILLSKAERILK